MSEKTNNSLNTNFPSDGYFVGGVGNSDFKIWAMLHNRRESEKGMKENVGRMGVPFQKCRRSPKVQRREPHVTVA